jgi:flavin reductase (DIM6/NTAB) family NADH-FMN oxidoreductase RutF
MDINPHQLNAGDMHKLLIGCVVPRPIAWVSSLDFAGCRNLAPFSFFNAISAKPAALSIAITYTPDRLSHRKDTLRNILEVREFVVNVTTEPNAAAMHQSAERYPADVDEFAEVGMTPVPSKTVRPPRVAEAPINFECTLHQTVPVGKGPGSATLVIGYIQHIHLRDDVLDNHYHVNIKQLQPVGRLAGNGYCSVRDLFELVRKPYKPEG